MKKIIVFSHKEKELASEKIIFISALAGGYMSYLVQNIFSFSVVVIAVLFFLFPAFVVTFLEETKELSPFAKKLLHRFHFITKIIYKRQLYTKLSLSIVFLFGLFFLLQVYRNWESDTFYKRGNDLTDSGYVGEGFNNFVYAIDLNPTEPLYRAELGFSAAAVAVSRGEQALAKAEEKDASAAAELQASAEEVEKIANEQTEQALLSSPHNTSIWRTAIRTYYQLSSLDAKYLDKTVETLDRTITLAPTDPKLYFNKALVLASQQKLDLAIQALQETVNLKPNYKEALVTLADFYFENNENQKAIQTAKRVLELSPDDIEAKKQLEKFTES